MAIASRKIRSLRDIRTNADRCDQFVDPYKGYLRLGTLEMERARKLKERANLEERLRVIEDRCRQLDAEKEAILKIINQQSVDMGHKKQVIPITRNVRKQDIAGHHPHKYVEPASKKSAKKTTDPHMPQKELSATIQVDEQPVFSDLKPGSGGFKIRY